MATTNYVTLVNNAIQEAGADLASFASDGSDFTSTSVDPMMKRIKTWTNRAWRDIQQDCFDWEWMHSDASVTIEPGILVTASNPAFVGALGHSVVNIQNEDGSIAASSVSLGNYFPVSDYLVSGKELGAYTIKNTSVTNPVTFGLKPVSQYILSARTAMVCVATDPVSGAGKTLSFIVSSASEATIQSAISDPSIIVNFVIDRTLSGGIKYGYIVLTPNIVTTYNPTATRIPICVSSYTGTSSYGYITAFTSAIDFADVDAQVVQGWKSYNFNEEYDNNDFAYNIQEINQKSFRLIDYYGSAPQSERTIEFIPWEQFRDQFDKSGVVPATPRVITEDDTGRYRFYPHPDRTYALKFEYGRKPQTLSAYNDTPTGIPDDYTDLIMWKTIMYYGEFDEQPAVYARAYKNYKTLLQKFEMEYRPKFNFRPHRMY